MERRRGVNAFNMKNRTVVQSSSHEVGRKAQPEKCGGFEQRKSSSIHSCMDSDAIFCVKLWKWRYSYGTAPYEIV